MRSVLTTLMVLLLAAGSYAQTWDELNEKVKQLTQAEAYAEAIPIAKQALELARKKSVRSDEYAASLNNLSTLYRNSDSLPQAAAMMLECIAVIKELPGISPADHLVCLDNLALIYFDGQEYAKAEKVLLEMLALSQKNPGTGIDPFEKLVVLYEQSGEPKKLEQVYVQKAAAYLKVHKVKDSNYADILTPLANFYVANKKFGSADSLSKELKQIIEKYYGDKSVEYATWAGNTGLQYSQMGKFAEAEMLLKQSLDMKQALLGKKSGAYAISLANLGLLYSDMAEFAKAKSAYDESHQLVKEIFGDSSREYAVQLMNEATLYTKTESFEEAEKLSLQSKAIIIYLREDNSPDYLTVIHQLGGMYLEMGRYAEAENYMLEAAQFVNRMYGNRDVHYAFSLNALANLYSEMGQTSKSLRYFVEASDIIKATLGETSLEYAASLSNLAVVADDPEMIEWAYITALSIVEKLAGTHNVDYLNKLGNLGISYLDNNKTEEAEKLLLKAMEISAQLYGNKSSDYAFRCMQLGKCYISRRDFNKGEELLSAALEISRKIPGEKNINHTKYLEAFVALYADQQQYRKAIHYLEEANGILLESLVSNLSVLSEKEKLNYIDDNIFNFAWMNSMLNNLQVNHGSSNKKNYDNLLTLRSLSLSDSRNTLANARNSGDSMVKEIYNGWLMGKAKLAKEYSLPQEERSAGMDVLEQQVESLEKELGRRSAGFSSFQKSLRINTDDIRNKMKEDEVAIEFIRFYYYDTTFRDSSIYAAYLLKKNDPVPYFIPLCNEKQLVKLLGTSKETKAIDALYRGAVKLNGQTAAGKALYDLLWKPLEPYLQGINKVNYSAAGILYNIAFHALPLDSGHVLMDRYHLRQYMSTKEIVSAEKENSFTITHAMLLGDPEFNKISASSKNATTGNRSNAVFKDVLDRSREGGSRSWQALPGTAVEINNIEQLLKQRSVVTEIFKQQHASEENVKALSGKKADLLHFATHGFFIAANDSAAGKPGTTKNSFERSADPLWRSGLILAGANEAWAGHTSITIEDGILTAYEISQLNLSGTELVVLSACETGLGEVTESEGVFGLQRAFKMAGVKKMLISLWPVPDKETAEMMSLFYAAILEEKNISLAFDKARAAMKKKYPPSYWAAFTLIE